MVGPRFVIMGDAAHAVLPTLGQGANSGLMDTYVLSQVPACPSLLSQCILGRFVCERCRRAGRRLAAAILSRQSMLRPCLRLRQVAQNQHCLCRRRGAGLSLAAMHAPCLTAAGSPGC